MSERPEGGTPAELNAAMAQRLADGPAQPLPEGGYGLRVLEVTGRRTGARHRVPIAVVGHAGAHYVVSPTARRSWVRNLLAGPDCALLAEGGTEPRRAVPAPAEEAVAVIGVYLAAMSVPWAIAAFPVPQHASAEQIRAHLAEMAVFRLEPAGTSR